jgi:Ala-tRNA(Pro) deacylase
MNMLNRCLDYLQKNKVVYSHSIHSPAQTAWGVAHAERVPPRELAKTVVYFGNSGFGMAVLPADEFVEFSELRRLLGLSFIRLATEAELAELFPYCDLGAMPPFGNLFEMPVLLDISLAVRDFIAFNAGTHRDVVRLSVKDFERLVKPLVGSFTTRKYAYA